MKNSLLYLLIILPTLICAQYNSPPEVTNVIFEQRTDGSFIVDVYYDLNDPDNDDVKISMEVSASSTDYWNTIISCNEISGDVGYGIINGTGKHIVWEFGKEHPDYYSENIRVKIIANDNKISGAKDFEFVNVPQGEFLSSKYDTSKTINYEYQIMKYEVTNLQFVEYLNEALSQNLIYIQGHKVMGYFEGDVMYSEGDYMYYNLSNHYSNNINQIVISYDGEKFSIDPDYSDHPVVNVTYIGALAFSMQHNFDIPTADEWEKAARGMTGFDYPWGDEISNEYTNFCDSGDYNDNGTTPVGFYNGENRFGFQTADSQSPYGCYDMSGNVTEMTKDYTYSGSYLKYTKAGNFYSPVSSTELNAWKSFTQYPNQESGIVGFRCVKR